MSVPVLETPRLVLRQYRLDDWPAHAALWADPRTTANFGCYTYDEESAWLRFLRNFGQWALYGYGYWGIEDKASRRYLGAVGFFQARRAIDLPFRDLPETGWVIHPDRHGQGLATEALAAVFAWGDENIDAPQSWCMIAPQNLASQKTAARMGYQPAMETQYKADRVLTYLRPRGGRT